MKLNKVEERFRKINIFTKEVKVGSFDSLSDLDVREWGYAELITDNQNEPAVLIESTIDNKASTLPILCSSILRIMARKMTIKRSLDRIASATRKLKHEILFRNFSNVPYTENHI